MSKEATPSVVVAAHALRLWGANKDFDENSFIPPDCHFRAWRFSSSTMIAFLTNSEVFASYYPGSPELLQSSKYGISVRTKVSKILNEPVTDFPGCESHVDKLLSVFGEIGLDADFPVVLSSSEGAIRDIIRHSLARFTLSQELEFSLKAFLYYLELPAEWDNSFGTRINLNDAITALLHRDFGKGACAGTHCCQVFALALRINETTPFLGSLHQELVDYLQQVSCRLEQTQEPNGAFCPNWSMSAMDNPLFHPDQEPSSRLRVTGHHLEWIAIAPATTLPSSECIVSAIDFLQTTLNALPAESVYHDYNSLSHAGRALALLSEQSVP